MVGRPRRPPPPLACARCSPRRCASACRAGQAALGQGRAGRGRDRRQGGLLAATPGAGRAARRPRRRRRPRVAARRGRRRHARRARRAGPAAGPDDLRLRAGELPRRLSRRSAYPRRRASTGARRVFDEQVEPSTAAGARAGAAAGRDRRRRAARADRRAPPAADRRGRRAARRAPGRRARRYEDAVLAVLGADGDAPRPHEDPDPGAARRAPDPPAARRDGQVGRLPHRVRPPRRAASPATTARSPRRWARRCWRPGCWPRSRRSASATSTSTRAARRRSAD